MEDEGDYTFSKFANVNRFRRLNWSDWEVVRKRLKRFTSVAQRLAYAEKVLRYFTIEIPEQERQFRSLQRSGELVS